MVPTLALGIPGSATTAVILTGLIIHGVLDQVQICLENSQNSSMEYLDQC